MYRPLTAVAHRRTPAAAKAITTERQNLAGIKTRALLDGFRLVSNFSEF
jgi:hypothetical protein